MHPDLKRQARKLRKQQQREERRALRRFRWNNCRCWWSWPMGHEYVNMGTELDPEWACVACDKAQYLVYHVCEEEPTY